MGLIFLEISNKKEYQKNPIIIENEAQKNYNKCIQSLNTLNELSNNGPMLTNIDDMTNKINALMENEKIKNTDYSFTQLNSTIDQAIKIQQKTDKNAKDIVDFYSTYNNFIDIYNRAR